MLLTSCAHSKGPLDKAKKVVALEPTKRKNFHGKSNDASIADFAKLSTGRQ